MIRIGQTYVNLDGNVFEAHFTNPFIPPTKQEYKDKYRPFQGKVQVEADRLFILYKALDEALKGQFIQDSLILNEDTMGRKAVVLTPPQYLSESAKAKGGVFGLKFHVGNPTKDEVVYTGRIILSLTYINLLKQMIKKNGLIQWLFYEMEEGHKIHAVVIERNKGKLKVIYPVNVELSDAKKAKLQLSVQAYLSGADKVPTVIVNDRVVFRKNNEGDYAIHTPHHSINLKKEDVEKLRLLVED